MVDRDVPGQPRPPQLARELPPDLAERLGEKRARAFQIVERPEAMDDADPEAVREERAVAPGPRAVLGLVAAESREVVAAIVVDDEQPTAWTEQPIGFGDLTRIDAPKAGPRAHHRVGASRGKLARTVVEDRADGRDARAGGRPARNLRGSRIDRDDVPAAQRAERLEGSVELAFAVEGGENGGFQ